MAWLDWFFRDRHGGRIVVAQFPNPALALFALFRAVAHLASEAGVREPAMIASEACLLVWAVDELARGVNPFRRCLGAAVLAWMAASRWG